MADTTPTGYIGTIIEAARDLLGASGNWKTLCGAADAAGARACTYANWYSGTPTKAIAVVSCSGWELQHYAADASYVTTGGMATVRFEIPQTTDPHESPQAMITATENSISAIIADMLAASGTSTYKPVLNVRPDEVGVRMSNPGQPYKATGYSIVITFADIFG